MSSDHDRIAASVELLLRESPGLPASDAPADLTAALARIGRDLVELLGGSRQVENAAAILRGVVATWPVEMQPGDLLIISEAQRVVEATTAAATAAQAETPELSEDAALLGLALRDARWHPRSGDDVATCLHALAVELDRRGGSPRASEAAAILRSAVTAWPADRQPTAADLAKAAGFVVQRSIERLRAPAPPAADVDQPEQPKKGKKKKPAAKPPPAPPAELPSEDGAPPWDGLDVEQLRANWAITPQGVVPVEWDGRIGAPALKPNKRLGILPLWPVRMGRDVATGRGYLEVAWRTPGGARRSAWLTEDDVCDGKPLLKLPGGPIAGTRWLGASVYLAEARSAIRNPPSDVTSRLGWCGINGARRWVWPGVGAEADAQYIGDPLPAHGELAAWQVGLQHVLTLGVAGYTALVCAALSAASPWARLVCGRRSPVLGLYARSSSGKGSVMCWALAIWADGESLTLPASSSMKGLQDRATQFPDLPIFCDELQQVIDSSPYTGLSQAQEAVYFLANGQRRVTSSKTQEAVGGEARAGVGYYAAEAPILPGMNDGVQLRVVELGGDPCPDEATARCLRQAGQSTGVLAKPISDLVQARPVTEWVAELRASSEALKKAHAGLRAGDGDVLALVQRGLLALEATCGEEIPVEGVMTWLASTIAAQRVSAIDRETLCLQAVLDWLGNLDWVGCDSKDGGPAQLHYRTEIALQQHLVAWSSWGPPGAGGRPRTGLECDPTHRDLAAIFDRYGGERRVLPAWAQRGWIERQGPHCKVRKFQCGRVLRFTPETLQRHYGEHVPVPSTEEAL
jgi:hypothetical protein